MYLFYINDVLLPVTPSKLNVKIKNQNKTINLVDGSEHNVLKLPGLSEYSFDCILPAQEYPFSQYDGEFLTPSYFLSIFEDLKNKREIAKLRILRSEPDTVGVPVNCTLEDYTIKEDAGSGFDIVVSLKFKEYVYHGTTTLNFTAKEDNSEVIETKTRPIERQPQTTKYKVVSGDTLWGIAKRYYGNGDGYNDIYEDNKEVIEAAAKAHGKESSSNGWWIYPGTELTITNAIK